MGLREKKAEKTRKQISSEALRLFKRDGYEQTTMEAIAEAAEVSPSTLYRYFPSKDLILLDPVANFGGIAAAFSRYAVNHPVEEALAEAILEWAKWQDTNSEEVLLVRSLIDQVPTARARAWDVYYQQERDLSARLAEKLHLPEDDLRVVLSAHLVFVVIVGTAADGSQVSDGRTSTVAYAKQVIKMFEEHKVILPRRAPRR